MLSSMEFIKRRSMAVLSFAHICDDENQSFLPALLPFLIANYGLSYSVAAGLAFIAGISSSVIQPLIGSIADKRTFPVLIAIGVFLSGAGIALIGIMSNYALIALAVFISGLGVSIFHPEASRFAYYAAGSHKATGMRWFTLGGLIGLTLGPLFATWAVLNFGLKGTLWAALPTTLATFLVLCEVRRFKISMPQNAQEIKNATNQWIAFSFLTVFIAFRSIAMIGLTTLLPLYEIQAMHASVITANITLTCLFGGGLLGTVLLTPLADHIERKKFLSISIFSALTFLVAAIIISTKTHSVILGTLFFALTGFVVAPSHTTLVILGQEYLPKRIGTASGVTQGLAVSFGNATVPILGFIGDHYNLTAAMIAITLALATSALLSLCLNLGEHLDTERDQSVTALPR
jgi:FSR family fosmidomycin resistance protein-like MFS transporter